MPQRTVNELRCFCRIRPILAVYGIEDGELYIHMRVFKARRIFGEVVITGDAKVKIHCRECFRWHTIKFVNRVAQLEETSAPDYIGEESPMDPSLPTTPSIP